MRSTRAPSSTPGQRGRVLESAPPPAPLSAAPAPAPPSPSRTPAPAPPSPARARAPAPPSPARARAPAPPSSAPLPSSSPAPPSAAASQPPSSAAPSPPPTSTEPTAATSSMDDLGSRTATEEGRHIKINLEDLYSALDTLGVSDAEKNTMIKSVSSKCFGVYNTALDSVKERCSTKVKDISVLEDQCIDICRVLGEIHRLPEQQTLTASLPVIHGLLTTALLRFEELKKERLKNLHAMQDQLIDLWDHLGVTIQDQKDYNYMMRNACVSLEEVTADDALSAGLLSEIKSEIKRLEGRLMQQIGQKIAMLAENLRQTHLSGHEDYELNFALIDVQEGRMDMFLADSKLKQLIVNSEKAIVTRAEILDCAEAIFKRRKDRGSHEEDEAGANSLVEKVKEWERMNKTKFFYDKGHIIEKLHKPETLCKYHAMTPPAAAAEKGNSPSWSESEDSGSDESGREQDPDFVPPSESDEE